MHKLCRHLNSKNKSNMELNKKGKALCATHLLSEHPLNKEDKVEYGINAKINVPLNIRRPM